MANIRPQNRDQFLDIAKGLAIILVVIGHVIQGGTANFDDLLEFKIIYSFHMPLFIFLSGAVAGIAFNSQVINKGVAYAVHAAWGKLKKAVIRLLVPFIAWCILNQLVYEHADGVLNALLLAFRRPDTALWFLLAIFYCVVMVSLFQILFALIYKAFQFLKLDQFMLANFMTSAMGQISLMILLWWGMKGHSPYGAGLGLLKPYFIYYALGLGFYLSTQGNFSGGYALIGGLLFVCLTPFWLRTAEFQYSGPVSLPVVIAYFFSGLVAISGISLFLGCARMVASTNILPLKKFLILCGQLSLGIYAIHYFFLAYTPKVIAPLLLSVGISFLLKQVPVVRSLFMGER